MNLDENKEILKNFGANLKRIRESKKLTLRGLSYECSIDSSDIHKIEKGLKDIRITTIIELAKGLGVHYKDLMDFDFEFE